MIAAREWEVLRVGLEVPGQAIDTGREKSNLNSRTAVAFSALILLWRFPLVDFRHLSNSKINERLQVLELVSWKASIVRQRKFPQRAAGGFSLLFSAPLADAGNPSSLTESEPRRSARSPDPPLQFVERRDIGLGTRRNNIRIGTDTIQYDTAVGERRTTTSPGSPHSVPVIALTSKDRRALDFTCPS